MLSNLQKVETCWEKRATGWGWPWSFLPQSYYLVTLWFMSADSMWPASSCHQHPYLLLWGSVFPTMMYSHGTVSQNKPLILWVACVRAYYHSIGNGRWDQKKGRNEGKERKRKKGRNIGRKGVRRKKSPPHQVDHLAIPGKIIVAFILRSWFNPNPQALEHSQWQNTWGSLSQRNHIINLYAIFRTVKSKQPITL